ncbi:NAD(P)-binding protein [Pleomassaria siparia CBS 279.74]|uniref:NAD(P)-binding protein n=1 Tax=Pleomassaria siparia CBS 279.74 TaxID=1314801 RepID=A0A6G1JQS6_9PLEO|nr:NAD(P)-binding protein [Pleomassaria siparia CBS 279.74]
MRSVLIVGANQGLGHSLALQYAKAGLNVYATARYSAPQASTPNLHWIPKIDVTSHGAGRHIAAHWDEDSKIDLLVICTGFFATDTLDALDWEKQLKMYSTTVIAPPFIVHHLEKAGLLKTNSRVVLIGSESGSIALRHESEGGGNYGGHGSKAALNMVGKLLSIDLRPKGIAVSIVHTGYLRKEGKDGVWETGDRHAVKPEEAATALRSWVETFDMSKTGQFWAIRGAGDIKTAEAVLGPVDILPTPLELPW